MKVKTINTGLNEEFILVTITFTGEQDQRGSYEASGSIEVKLERSDGSLSEIKAEALQKAKSIMKRLAEDQ